MKTGIHPEMHDVVFIDSSTGAQFITRSTTKTEETMKIDGKEYFVIKVEISSDSHPFYTGKQKLIDTAGRVDKFMAKMKKAQELAAKNVKKVDEDEDAEDVAKETAEETVEEAPSEEVAEEEKKEEAEAPVQTSIEDAAPEVEEEKEETTEEEK